MLNSFLISITSLAALPINQIGSGVKSARVCSFPGMRLRGVVPPEAHTTGLIAGTIISLMPRAFRVVLSQKGYQIGLGEIRMKNIRSFVSCCVVLFMLCLILISCVGSQNYNASAPGDSGDETPVYSNTKASVANEKQPTPQVEEKAISDVGFCMLLQSPEKFEQQPVRVKAIFRRGFEKSQFYSLKCPTDKHVWVDGRKNTKCSNAGSLNEINFDGGELTVGVVVVGKLTGIKGNYGHTGVGDYEFAIKCVERYELLDRSSTGPLYLTPQQRRKIEKFERSN